MTAIRPTPAEKGLARLSEALASPAVVNNDVLWARCGVLDNMAPPILSAMLLHSDRGGTVVGGDGVVLSMLMVWMWISASRRAGRVPCVFRLRRQRLQLKLFSLIKLRKQCRRLVPFLFGEANPNPNLKPTWLTIMASRARRPDEPEVSRWRAGGGVW